MIVYNIDHMTLLKWTYCPCMLLYSILYKLKELSTLEKSFEVFLAQSLWFGQQGNFVSLYMCHLQFFRLTVSNGGHASCLYCWLDFFQIQSWRHQFYLYGMLILISSPASSSFHIIKPLFQKIMKSTL